MDDFTITGENRPEFSFYQSLFKYFVLGHMETYDASKLDCWAFHKSTDERCSRISGNGNVEKTYRHHRYTYTNDF